MANAAIVSSETPTWRNLPEKSPFRKIVVPLRNPSVLSLFDRSADATIMLSTRLTYSASTLDEALRVALLAGIAAASAS